jgi:hypothetical protein
MQENVKVKNPNFIILKISPSVKWKSESNGGTPIENGLWEGADRAFHAFLSIEARLQYTQTKAAATVLRYRSGRRLVTRQNII